MSIKLTKGNVSDLNSAEYLSKNLIGKLFGDKGYISKDLAARLYKKRLATLYWNSKGYEKLLNGN